VGQAPAAALETTETTETRDLRAALALRRRILASTELLGALDDRTVDALLGEVEWVQIAGGATLFRQGDTADALYIVVTGRLVAVFEEADGSEQLVREIGRGENVGELAMLTEEPRSATVRAVRDSELARIDRACFEALVARHPPVMTRLARMLAGWVGRSNRPRRSPASVVTIALLPVGRDARSADLAAGLVAALAKLGPTAHVHRERVAAECRPSAPDEEPGSRGYARTSEWLDELEVAHRYVVYEGSAASASWSRRCLRQADRVVLVADATAHPAPTLRDLHETFGALRPTCELALVSPESSTSAVGTASWLEHQRFAAHHHLRLASRSDVERLARRLTGNSTALVLSGGGARGFAHIGVVRALAEAGIPIDRIGGTSMGAVIGAQLACGLDAAAMLELNRLWLRDNPLRDWTLPIVSLISGRGGVKLLGEMFGDRRIEDLWIEYFCTTTNLTRSRLVVHREGLLRRAVRASISIPGIAPPAPQPNGDLLVDGAVLNNLPVDVMVGLGAGAVVAVDVAPAEDLSVDPRYEEAPSSWRLLLERVNPLQAAGPRFPGIYRILERTMLVASLAHSAAVRNDVDLYLDPPVGRFAMFDWSQLDELAETGYRFASERIEQWRRSSVACRRTLDPFEQSR
jgi:predicted acylesterase/phospholipase RssA/CRP-like cAMP-binding protein